MPPLPPVPNVLHCQHLFSDGSDAGVITTQYYRYSGGPPTATDLNAMAADIYAFGRDWLSLMDNFTIYTGVKLTDLSSSSGAQGVYESSTGGARGTDVLAGGTCVLTNYVINRRYRGGKPRNYWPFFVQTDLASRQAWEGAAITALEGNLSTFFSNVIGVNSGTTTITDHVNVSYYDGFTVETSPSTGRARNVPKRRTTPVVDTIVSFSSSTRPASQRRRN